MTAAEPRPGPIVSVLLPVYNGAKTVERAIESIRAQTFADWELIAYDDGSTDSSAQIVSIAAEADARIRVLRGEVNRGLGHAMNQLCAAARGRYCAVQEQDDRSLPSRLALEVDHLESHPDVGVVAGISSLRGWDWTEIGQSPELLVSGQQYPPSHADLVRYLYLSGCQVDNAGAMFRREIVSGGISFDEQAHSSADWQFYLDAAHRWRFHGLHDVLVEMARSPGHAHITDDSERMFAEMRRCVDVVQARYGADPTSPVDGALRRQALSNIAVKQARARGARRGLPPLLVALRWNVANTGAWALARSWAGAALRYPLRPRNPNW